MKTFSSKLHYAGYCSKRKMSNTLGFSLPCGWVYSSTEFKYRHWSKYLGKQQNGYKSELEFQKFFFIWIPLMQYKLYTSGNFSDIHCFSFLKFHNEKSLNIRKFIFSPMWCQNYQGRGGVAGDAVQCEVLGSIPSAEKIIFVMGSSLPWSPALSHPLIPLIDKYNTQRRIWNDKNQETKVATYTRVRL